MKKVSTCTYKLQLYSSPWISNLFEINQSRLVLFIVSQSNSQNHYIHLAIDLSSTTQPASNSNPQLYIFSLMSWRYHHARCIIHCASLPLWACNKRATSVSLFLSRVKCLSRSSDLSARPSILYILVCITHIYTHTRRVCSLWQVYVYTRNRERSSRVREMKKPWHAGKKGK